MAIIKELPGLEGVVKVNGQVAQEYDDPYIDLTGEDELDLLATATKAAEAVFIDVKKIPHVVKYIEAVPGAEFTIEFTKRAAFVGRCNHLAVMYEADGIPTIVQHEPRELRGRDWTEVFEGWKYGSVQSGYFDSSLKFGNLKKVEMTDSAIIDEDILKSNKLGTLRILVYKMKRSTKMCLPHDTDAPPMVDEVSEKAIKGEALDASVQLGAATPTVVHSRPDNVFQDPQERPFAYFEFRYLTKEGLIHKGIIPKPTPIDSMTEEEVRKFALKLHRERESSIKSEHIKGECDGTGTRGLKRGTSSDRLPPAKRFKEIKREDGLDEVDLT
ncbi:hypothetical protein F4780DRAFT_785469 [Xylariomycetidae sp. FL0641]|nr:hypothetical protein F4780DRAFT_785469 [Xylariomycetidae sp. FL0641]